MTGIPSADIPSIGKPTPDTITPRPDLQPATPVNAPAIDPDATFIENQAPYDDTVLEAPPSSEDAAGIEKAKADLASAANDTTFREAQPPEPGTGASPTNPAKFDKPNFYVDTVNLNDEPIPMAIPKVPPTRVQRIVQTASKLLLRR